MAGVNSQEPVTTVLCITTKTVGVQKQGFPSRSESRMGGHSHRFNFAWEEMKE